MIPSSDRRKLMGDIRELNELSTGLADIEPTLRRNFQRAIEDLGAQLAGAAQQNPASRVEDLLPTHGVTLRNLLKDPRGEPLAGEAFLGSDGYPYSPITIAHHVYCSPSGQREGPPQNAAGTSPWTVKKHPELTRLVQLFRRDNWEVTPSPEGVGRFQWLNLPTDFGGEAVERLPPLSLGRHLYRTVEALNWRAMEAVGTHKDELSSQLANWSRSFLIILSSLRDAQRSLRGVFDEWELLHRYERILREELLVDPLEGTPLLRGALLGNDEKRSTFNPNTRLALKQLYPELLFQPHPVLGAALDWLQGVADRLKPLRLHLRRQDEAERFRRRQEDNVVREELARRAAEEVRRNLEQFRHEGQRQLDGMGARLDRLAPEVQALVNERLRSEEQVAELGLAMRSCANEVSAFLQGVFAHREGIKQTSAELEAMRAKAAAVRKEVETLRHRSDQEAEQLGARNKKLQETLAQISARADEVGSGQIAIEKEMNELRRKLAERRSGFLNGLLVVVGIGLGIVTGGASTAAALQAGMAEAGAKVLGTCVAAGVATGFGVASKVENPKASVHATTLGSQKK